MSPIPTVAWSNCSSASTIAKSNPTACHRKPTQRSKRHGWKPTAKKGALTKRGKVSFLDAAHRLHATIPRRGWIKRTNSVILKTNSGRNRLNILGAYSPDDQSLISWEGRESCDAERVAAVLKRIRKANPGKRLLVVLDNAPSNHAPAVTEAAKTLRIELRYLPTYSPNLNLIERFWKFLLTVRLFLNKVRKIG